MAKKTKKKSLDVFNYLITHNNPKSPIAEAYRTLRTNLGFAAVDKQCRSIMVTSSNPQEGKSTTTANLAVALAQAGSKTVLIDCDLRKPIVHHIFRLPNHQGLTNCLTQKKTIEEVCHMEVMENLTVVTSGPIPPNPAELLGSQSAKELWPDLLDKYDYILIDSPPVLAVADATVLASQMDGVVLVVHSGKSRTEAIREAKGQLLKGNANIIGVVLNQVNMNSGDYQYYYYYASDSPAES